jgi:hypothetical protein
LFNYEHDAEWVIMVGRYMLNMGVAELATKNLIARLSASDAQLLENTDLPLASRIGFLKKRFPRTDASRHQWAMNVFDIAEKHAGFRNSIAHSGLALSESEGELHIHGILDIPKNAYREGGATLISLTELKRRVTESALVANDLLDMQNDFIS